MTYTESMCREIEGMEVLKLKFYEGVSALFYFLYAESTSEHSFITLV